MDVANTFVRTTPEEKASYFEIGAQPMEPIIAHRFAMLDLLVLPASSIDNVISLHSDRLGAISLHHFPVLIAVKVQIIARRNSNASAPNDWATFSCPAVRQPFV